MPNAQLDEVTSALNFDTIDFRVEGSCDLYMTKVCGSDKKLYKSVIRDLGTQYETLLQAQRSQDSREAEVATRSLKLAKSSPFGPPNQVSSRRTFAYMIATLNASHSDYDFTGELKPTDFIVEKDLRQVMNTFDTMLYNLRPKPPIAYGSPHWTSAVTPAGAIVPTQKWSPKMWRLIDEEMDLAECTIYSLSQDAELYDEEERVIWSFNYFFFNKTKKRVCYLYLKGMSVLNEDFVPDTPLSSKKRLRIGSDWDEDTEDEMLSSSHYYDHEDWLLPRLELGKYALSRSTTLSPGVGQSRSRSSRRGISEDVVESMEI